MGINRLVKKIRSYDKNADFELVKKAYETSKRLHAGQKRKSGEDYIVHPLETACIIAELKLDDMAVCAGLLHDVLENTSYGYDALKKDFGCEIAEIVDGVSKIKGLKEKSREKYNAESMKKMLLATARDIRIVLVKLADKLHNMRTLASLEEGRRKRIALETIELYAPLAYRLGLADIKWELEDLAFKELHAGLFNEFNEKIAKTRKQRELEINKLRRELGDALRKNKIKVVDISGRAKNFYSIYRKMQKKSKKFEEIYDLIGLRCIVHDVKSCYCVLGVIHGMWKPLPGKFKDYIARPKENLYQSLHTVAVTDDGEMVEVQVRTKEMDDIANEGIAAHWRYKGFREEKGFDKKLGWVKQMLDYKGVSGEEFMKSLMKDIFGDRSYVFTPKGDVVELPAGSCVVDFAYAVHSDLGNKCIGGRVNDKFVSLRHMLNSGDVVEVVIDKNRVMPARDWLGFVKSQRAAEKIRHALSLIQKIPAGGFRELSSDESRKSLVETGLGKCVVHLGKCCNPLPGEELVGLAAKSGRVMIHNKGCRALLKKKESGKRKVDAWWKKEIDGEITIRVIAYDRIGLFADISNTMALLKKNVIAAKAYTYNKKDAACEFRMHFNDMDELAEVITRIKKVADVQSVGLVV
ncbi:MAG TPA: RelA/SpoT family protein [Candidatus Nanoarchaeia archaeon]|nr:RelA/SpoT family protein [Candidatus Nanoarchaeia archaeon]